MDGSCLAAVLCLGAAGVLLGTRFLATPEAPATAHHKRATQRAEAEDDLEEMINLAGMGVGRIHELKPAGQIVQDVVAEAVAVLQRLGAKAPVRAGEPAS